MTEGEAMAHIQGLNVQIETLRTDVRDGFSGIHRKLDGVVPRSELDLIKQHYEQLLEHQAREQKELASSVSVLRRWIYAASGLAAGSIPVNQAVSMLLS